MSKNGLLSELTAAELEMLGHALRVVPGNSCLTGASAARMGKPGVAMLHECEPFLTLWNKVAHAISERDDLAEARTK